MLFFVTFGSGQGGQWSLGPLLLAVPFLLQFAPAVLEAVFNGLLDAVPFSRNSHAQLLQPPSTALRTLAYLNLLICGLGIYFFIQTALRVRRHGGMPFLMRLLLQGYRGGFRSGAQGAARRRPAQPPRATIEQIAEHLQRLPMEQHMCQADLERAPIHNLKEMLHKRGMSTEGCVEKRELVARLVEHGGSSASSCSICCEDYTPEDAVRILKCGHRYHLECVDKWFLSATDYSRAPACPLCNAPLLDPSPAPPQQATLS